MRMQWLKRREASELIVVFGGWALGSAPFQHLEGDQDVMFVEDYRQLDKPLSEVRDYDSCNLLAFSYGVASAAHWLDRHGDPFKRKSAVNGTLYPTDPERGIPEPLVRQTAQELSESTLRLFARRCGTRTAPASADLSALKDELHAICARGAAPRISFDKVWLTSGDRIFPPTNMERAWADSDLVPIWIDGPHEPFSRWSRWEDVLA